MPHELAEKFLDEAEGLIEQEEAGEPLIDALEHAQQLNPDDAHILCRSARLLYRYGILNSKGRFLLLALDKLKLACEKDSHFFDDHYIWWQLWGNILVQLGKLVQDSTLYELALEKFESAARAAPGQDPHLLWDWADGWIFLAHKSGELADFQRGISKFRLAVHLGIESHFFQLDFGHALGSYAYLSGNPSYMDEAISLFSAVISESYNPEENKPSIVYLGAWRKLAQGAKTRFELTHRADHLEAADKAICEAILACPTNSSLWLDWGELFLHAGWRRRDVKLLETGLEKLTASKVKECDPIRVSALLGSGLIFYGLSLENLKLLHEGRERIDAALEVASTSPHLRLAKGLSEMAQGIYFADTEALAKAAAFLSQEAEENGQEVDLWYALFQTYFFWGLQEDDLTLLQKGIAAIRRICEQRPFSSTHLNELGVALLRMRHFEEEKERLQQLVEEAIALFKKASELSEDEDSLYNMGCAYDVLGDVTGDEDHYAKAIDLLSKVLDKKPTNLYARYHLGLSLSHLGELLANAECLMQAIELLEPVTRVEKEDENVWTTFGYTLLNLAQSIDKPHHPEEQEKRLREAEKALIRAVELGSGDACYHLTCLYALTGHPESALFYLKKAASAGALPPREDLEHDEWLDNIRESQAFRDLLEREGENG